jgi:hypothetical protein
MSRHISYQMFNVYKNHAFYILTIPVSYMYVYIDI